jgi:hypothetical protein
MAAIRARLTFANVMSVVAVFIALGGSAIAINKIKANSVGTKQLKTGAVQNTDIADNAVTSPKVANGSLKDEDFAAGQIPAGATGPQGPQGQQGATGTVDTSNFYDKSASDARFLGIGATAADSNKLAGTPAPAFPVSVINNNSVATNSRSDNSFGRRTLLAGTGLTTIVTINNFGSLRASCSDPAQTTVEYRNTSGSTQDVWVQDMEADTLTWQTLANNASASAPGGAGIDDETRWNFVVGSGESNSGSFHTAVIDVVTVNGPFASNVCRVQVQAQSLSD